MAKGHILLVIAARGGSKGVKNKNIRRLCGLPLIAHTILQARRWGKADMIICSTDSLAIIKVAKKYGAEVLFRRPAALANDTCGKIEVLRHALKAAEKIMQQKFHIIIDLDVTAPLRKICDIEGAYTLFMKKRPKSVFTVTLSRRNPYFNIVEINSRGYASLVKRLDSSIKRRQDAPLVYDMNASIYIYDREYLLDKKTKTAISDESLIFLMDELSSFDLDREIDFQFISFLVKKGLVKL